MVDRYNANRGVLCYTMSGDRASTSFECDLKTNLLVSQLLIFFHLGFDGGDVSIGVCSSLMSVHERLTQTLSHVVVEAR